MTYGETLIQLIICSLNNFFWREWQKQAAATEFSKISLLFFHGSNLFIIFQEGPFGSICSSNRHGFSRRVHLFVEQTWIFQEGLFMFFERTDTNFHEFSRKEGFNIEKTKRHVFSRKFYLFVEQTLLSHQRDSSKLVFPETLISPQTHTNFQGASIFSSNRYSFSRKPYIQL